MSCFPTRSKLSITRETNKRQRAVNVVQIVYTSPEKKKDKQTSGCYRIYRVALCLFSSVNREKKADVLSLFIPRKGCLLRRCVYYTRRAATATLDQQVDEPSDEPLNVILSVENRLLGIHKQHNNHHSIKLTDAWRNMGWERVKEAWNTNQRDFGKITYHGRIRHSWNCVFFIHSR